MLKREFSMIVEGESIKVRKEGRMRGITLELEAPSGEYYTTELSITEAQSLCEGLREVILSA